MSWTWVFVLNGTKAPTPENEERSGDFLVCKIVTRWRPCTCNLARNAVAMPSRSTIIRVRLSVSRVLFIPFQKYGDAHGEMLVSAMGGNAQGMAVLVVQQQERAAPQNDAQTPDQSAREKHVTVDGLTMPIDIAGQRMGLGCVFCEGLWGMPELVPPPCKTRRKPFSAFSICH